MGETMMKHFKVLECGDPVNHAASDMRRRVLGGHRGTLRKRYVETVPPWQKLARAAAFEADYQPSPETVQVVKAAFAAAGFAARREETDGLVQQLYDSFSHPAPAGMRSAGMRIRQMLYRAEPYQIDLHIELQPEQNRLLVSGQLVDLSHSEMVGRDVRVTLSDGRESVANTITNQFGEFRGEIENSGDLELSLLAPTGKPIVILVKGALKRLSAAKD
jgi:hypothetical protein